MRLINGDRVLMKLNQHRLLFFAYCGDFSILSEKDKSRVDEIDSCIADVINAPTIDPEELRPKGEWKRMEDSECYWFECSECGEPPLKKYKYDCFSHYCPNCGADMRGDGHD